MSRPFQLYGHRGARGLAPENTLAGMRLALEHGVDGLEIDVHYAHGKLWVIHDPDVDRTTNGAGALAELSHDHLRALDAGNGEPIPFLEEVIELTAGQVPLNVELKHPEAAIPAVEILQQFPKQPFLVSSFSAEALRIARDAAGPELPLGVLVHDPPPDFQPIWDLCEELGAWSLHPFFPHATQALIRAAHDRALLVYAYTVNDPREALRLRELGAQGVFTDFPDKLQNLRILAE